MNFWVVACLAYLAVMVGRYFSVYFGFDPNADYITYFFCFLCFGIFVAVFYLVFRAKTGR